MYFKRLIEKENRYKILIIIIFWKYKELTS